MILIKQAHRQEQSSSVSRGCRSHDATGLSLVDWIPRMPISATAEFHAEGSDDELEAAEQATCKTGQSCIGCFSGVIFAYLALILFRQRLIVIVVMVCDSSNTIIYHDYSNWLVGRVAALLSDCSDRLWKILQIFEYLNFCNMWH